MTVEVRNLCKTIRCEEVLREVTLSVPDGQVTALRGTNGSGKTMIMRAICGFVRPTAGSVWIDGRELWRDMEFPPSLGMLIERPAFLDDCTGLDNLSMLADIRSGCSHLDAKTAMERMGLDPGLKKPYKTYSLGMKQRLGVAAAIMGAPSLLVLDEPTNALDDAGADLLMRVIGEEKGRGAAILLSSHDRQALQSVADVIYVIEDGRIVGKEVPGNAE